MCVERGIVFHCGWCWVSCNSFSAWSEILSIFSFLPTTRSLIQTHFLAHDIISHKLLNPCAIEIIMRNYNYIIINRSPKIIPTTENWDFESYNTNTDIVIDQLLRPTNFANVTVPHKPNRAVIFDSALFHQTDKYRFKKGYENGRINLTLLFGEMKKGHDNGSEDSGVKQEL